MPLYEFVCKHCGEKIEQLCKLGEDGQQLVCPFCDKRGLKRELSAFSLPGVGGGDKCGGCPGGNCSNC